MDNEEKILSMLEKMNERFDSLEQQTNQRFDKLEQGQAQTNQRLDKLEQDMKRDLNDTSTEILSAVEAVIRYELKGVKHSIAVIEVEHGKKLDALYDGFLMVQEKQEKYANLETRVENLEIDMAAVRMTLKDMQQKTANDT